MNSRSKYEVSTLENASTNVRADNNSSVQSSKVVKNVKKKQLSLRTKLAFSVGHVFNDLCASMWFSYLLTFLELVLRFESRMTGALLLLGQVADAIATPLIGIQSDKRYNFLLCRYGRRKIWHLIGTVLIAATFPFLFNKCLGCADRDQWLQFAYYGVFVTIFQIGWAANQVAHVSLITDLTPFSAERVELNAYRHAFTVISSICVYSITWVVLGVSEDNDTERQLGPQDAHLFRNIVFSVLPVGIAFSVIFHFFVKETNPETQETRQNQNTEDTGVPLEALDSYRPRSYSFDINALIHSNHAENNDSKIQRQSHGTDEGKLQFDSEIELNLAENHGEQHLTWKEWLKKLQFYEVAFVYMASRMFVNLSQVYTPLYLQDTLRLPRESIAIVPLVTYLSGFLSSLAMKPVSVKIGTKVTLLGGSIISIITCIWVFFGTTEAFISWQIYIVGGLFGIGGTTMLVASLAITADLIAHNTNSGAFVFGAMSFFDKLGNGAVVLLIQELNPKQNTAINTSDDWYHRSVLAFACGGSALLTLLGLLILSRSQHKLQTSESKAVLKVSEE
ncbi:major facilitator superfamily domain-containing protein 12-like [Limulus polyphemus]|uniref:Major facilitator superfamily domain-containing protein 12-like n=1 Tax=Limulus polyphemus TaxID=6850 RepID=A0ABM1S6Z6_LIMPO|nr:major facilitator superfamily domain-containing protein 12-like [Limulus polyphemus]